MRADFFPILELEGGPHDVGQAHGRALAGEIKKNLALYYSMVRGLNGLEPDQCLAHASEYLTTMREEAPDLLEEMEGISQGAGVSREEIMFLNARSEIVSVKSSGITGAGECTALGLTGERTVTGDPILAQNWDWHERVTSTFAVFNVRPANGVRALYLAEAGQVGKIGVNEFGVGVLLNILFTDQEVRYGLPVHVLLRMVLGCRETGEAMAAVKKAPRAGSSHFLVGDSAGNITGLELTPDGVGEIAPVNGAVVHTNHYCIPGLVQKDTGLDLLPDSPLRLSRAKALLSRRERWDSQTLSEIFTNHEDGLPSICRHVNPSDLEFLRMLTIASCMIDLSQKKILVSCGQPCRAPYREIVLK